MDHWTQLRMELCLFFSSRMAPNLQFQEAKQVINHEFQPTQRPRDFANGIATLATWYQRGSL